MDQALIDNVYKMSRPAFEKDGNPVSRPVQTLYMMAHELSLYQEKARATAAAKSIISMVTKGEGIKGGLRKADSGPKRFFNKTEKELVRDAITKAADYLQTQNELDLFLQSSIGSMIDVWNDDAAKKHGSIVLSLLTAAREKVRETDIHTAKTYAGALIPDGADAVLAQVIDDSNWRSATAYMAASRPKHRYNAIVWKIMEDARSVELTRETESVYKARILKDFPIKALTPTTDDIGALEGMAEQLEQTLISGKALALSNQIMGCLKHNGTDLRSMVSATTTEQKNFRKAVIRALAAVERFRRFELEDGSGLETTAPKVLDYQNSSANPQSQAVLIALVTAIQKLIDYPLSSIDNLKDFFDLQKNDSETDLALRGELKDLNADLVINPTFFPMISEALKQHLPIVERQKILIDQQALEHRLIYEAVPEFNFETGEKTLVWRFLRKIRSEGDGWCGYYSFRNIKDSKSEYIRKIANNLHRPDVRTAVLSLLGIGNKIYTGIKRKLADQLYDELRIATDQTPAQTAMLLEIQENLRNLEQHRLSLETRLQEMRNLPDGRNQSAEGFYAQKNEAINKLLIAEHSRATEAKQKADDAKAKGQTLSDDEIRASETNQQNIALLNLVKTIKDLESQLKVLEDKLSASILNLEHTAPLIKLASTGHLRQRIDSGILTDVQAGIIQQIERITDKQEQAMRGRWPDGIPEHESEPARLLRESFEAKKVALYTELARTAEISDGELVKQMTAEIDAIDYGQYLNMGTNIAWRDQPFTFPYVYSSLMHSDYYVWIQTKNRKRWPGHTQPSVYENGKYMLATLVSARDKYPFPPHRVHLFNSNGEGHYDKWVEEGNGRLEEGDAYYPDLADSLRHKKLYNLALTRPIKLN
ncbi:MAG: hypothetical protein K2W94_02210 [Alphaproteobacteria bacterium]|nr:hypothetical protein [Alphaproteobacteria bacterium]